MEFEVIGRLKCGRCGEKFEFIIAPSDELEEVEERENISGWREILVANQHVLLCPPCQKSLGEWMAASAKVNKQNLNTNVWNPKNLALDGPV